MPLVHFNFRTGWLKDSKGKKECLICEFFEIVRRCCFHKMAQKDIYYSDKYYDDIYEYRHVMLPKSIAKLVSKDRTMSEEEWRRIGVQQSQGWVHYMSHKPEPHILLFRRPHHKPLQEVQNL